MSRLRQWTDKEGVRWECDAYDHGPMCRQCTPVCTTCGYGLNYDPKKGHFCMAGHKQTPVEMQTLTMTPQQVEDLIYALNFAVSAKPNGYHVGAAFKTLNLMRDQGVTIR